MAGGQIQAIGPKEEVLRKVLAPVPAAPKATATAPQPAPSAGAVLRTVTPGELRLEVK